MQVQNTTSPNFKAIKSVKCEGLYKKYPEFGQQLVNTFQQNPKAMDFCKKYDVNIVFYAFKKAFEEVESSIHIFYDNPAASKIKKFFQSLNGNKEQIVITSWGNQYDIKGSLEASTKDLKQHILPWQKGTNSTGVLDSHLRTTDKKIQESVSEKLAQKPVKKATAEAQDKLNDSIKSLMDSTK